MIMVPSRTFELTSKWILVRGDLYFYEDRVEGPPMSASTKPIAKDVRQKLDLWSMKFEILCDKDQNSKGFLKFREAVLLLSILAHKILLWILCLSSTLFTPAFIYKVSNSKCFAVIWNLFAGADHYWKGFQSPSCQFRSCSCLESAHHRYEFPGFFSELNMRFVFEA